MRWGIVALGLCFQTNVFALDDVSQQVLIDRIRPLGAVHVDQKQTQSASATAATPTRSGDSVYHQHCIICHESGVAGAPKFRNAAEWAPRVAKAGGIAGLLTIVNEGLNAMPPKGTCQECSEEELKHAIEYMLPK